MGWAPALVAAVIQGLTEFLPISSSGHLALLELMWRGVEPDLAYAVLLHVGTLGAVLAFYRRDVGTLLLGWRTRGWGPAVPEAGTPARFPEGIRAAWGAILAATLPTAAIGLAFEERVEAAFASPRTLIATFSITGALLAISYFLAPRALQDRITLGRAFLIGIAQGLAIFPGISRSGATIVAGMLLGLSGLTAMRFSFLISIPAVAGAALLKSRVLLTAAPETLVVYATGTLIAFAVGWLSLVLLRQMVRRLRLWWFAFYCLVPALIALLLAQGLA